MAGRSLRGTPRADRAAGAGRPPRIQILHVAGCPLVDGLRRTVHAALERSGFWTQIEELEGPYPSPTLLIDGLDVTGRPLATGPACRMDLPTEEQIVEALAAARAAPRRPRAQPPRDGGPSSGVPPRLMTIGSLARRTGVPVKLLREYEDMGLIYTVGRSPGNYRLFDDDALWCVGAIGALRSLGLTVAEVREFAEFYLREARGSAGPALARMLAKVRVRTEAQIADLRLRLERIDRFAADHRAELAGHGDFREQDPRARSGVDSAPGGRV